MKKVPSFLAAALGAALLCSQPAPPQRVGPLPGGGFLLNSGWKLQPAGRQIPLGSFPTSLVASRDGNFLFVLNAGAKPSLSVIVTASARVADSAPLEDAGLGMTVSPRADRVYVGGGAHASVYEFTFDGSKLRPGRTFAVVPQANRTANSFIGDVAFSPDGRLLYATDLFDNWFLVINPQSGTVIQRFKAGQRPYRILFPPDGKSFFVTSDGSVTQYDTATGSNVGVVRIGAHPTDLVWRNGGPDAAEGQDRPAWTARLFVAAANTNNVYSVGVSAGNEMTRLESINIGFSPDQPLGMTPSALALSPDGKRLYVACSGANAVAVVDVSGERSFTAGFIPVGWYPTAVAALKSGGVVALNAKTPAAGTGSASWIDPFAEDQLAQWTLTAAAASPYASGKADAPAPLPEIQHVIYVVKGSRTYDQVLGDLKEGAGDAARATFGENVTPNQHKLAREFVLFDNFYVNGDGPAGGLQWSTGGIASDFVMKLERSERELSAQPPAGYLWTNAASAGIPLRNYGFFAPNAPGVPGVVHDPVLSRPNITNLQFRGVDPDFPDAERAKVFVSDLAEFEKSGNMPGLILMRLANDAASRSVPGKITPASTAADNDYALGVIVDAISHSTFWRNTAILVLEADAQDGNDHVDSHRSLAFVISPYVKRRTVDSTMYNTISMLRTAEVFLGLHPMTHFDAGARPMTAVFQSTPDASPYTVEKPRIRLDERDH
ncbi:MAG TPA: bifunctional YncE family protein/alkaline phosphatase family protein [Bryobacteraceae bacterium]|nr:bifunctional YncE family protein/alkaline phosphatase family protein [Bryobacteraceae bacterium]